MKHLKTLLATAIFAFYFYLIVGQFNSGNFGGIVISLTLIMVFLWNIFLRYEYRSLYKSFKDTRRYAERYWQLPEHSRD